MTNEEKSREIGEFFETTYLAALEMAEWKDAQFKEYLEKKIYSIKSMEDIDTVLKTDTAVIRTLQEIINELFKED